MENPGSGWIEIWIGDGQEMEKSLPKEKKLLEKAKELNFQCLISFSYYFRGREVHTSMSSKTKNIKSW